MTLPAATAAPIPYAPAYAMPRTAPPRPHFTPTPSDLAVGLFAAATYRNHAIRNAGGSALFCYRPQTGERLVVPGCPPVATYTDQRWLIRGIPDAHGNYDAAADQAAAYLVEAAENLYGSLYRFRLHLVDADPAKPARTGLVRATDPWLPIHTPIQAGRLVAAALGDAAPAEFVYEHVSQGRKRPELLCVSGFRLHARLASIDFEPVPA